MNQTIVPSSAIKVTAYTDLAHHCDAFVQGFYGLLMIVGSPGVAKSQSIRGAIGNRDHCFLDSHVSPLGIYSQLYDYMNLPVVMDDLDGLFADRICVRLLKAICNTDPVKTVSWISSRMACDSDGATLPMMFQTTSPVCLIANEWRTLNANVAAIEDRALVLHFCPSAGAVHGRVGEWFHDHDVYDFMADYLPLISEPSMRFYVKGSQLRRANPEHWRDLLLEMIGIEERDRFILKLLKDPTYPSEESRVHAFTENGFGDRATYYRRKRRINFTPSNERANHANATA